MLTQEKLQELLWYDFLSGKFFWRKTGKPAGEIHRAYHGKTSYCRIGILGKRYFAHNLVWLYVFGVLPLRELDHKDRNGLHNRVINLRKSSTSENKFNTSTYKNSTTGVRGIYIQKGRYRVEIRKDCKKYSLGMFDDLDTAIAMRNAKAKELFGEFA